MKPYPYMKTQYKVLFRVVDVILSLSISSCLAWGFHPTLVRSRFSCFLLYFVSPSFFLVLFTPKLLQCPQLLHLHFPLMLLLLMIFLLHFKFDSRECITWHIKRVKFSISAATGRNQHGKYYSKRLHTYLTPVWMIFSFFMVPFHILSLRAFHN